MSTAEQITLSFRIVSTDYSVPLGMRVSLDRTVIYENAHLSDQVEIQHPMSDDDGEHELTFEMFGKTSEHTKIDQDGNIISDAMLSISSIEIDQIDIDYLAQLSAVYHHDFNGSQSVVEDKFYGSMGCNGVVIFKFSSPIYLWFLENM
jgi:hypothetical protein